MDTNINDKLEKLEKYKKNRHPVLSVYLGENSKKSPSAGYFITELKSLIKKTLSKKQQKIFTTEIEKIEKYLQEHYDSRGKRGVAFFTSKNELWEVVKTEFSLPDLCKIAAEPYTSPLVDAMNDHEKYLVLLVDRKKARLFTVNLGVIEKRFDFYNGEVPQTVRQINEAWGREDKIFRHIEDHLHRHLKIVTDKLKDFAKGKHIQFIVIGGHEEIFSKMIKHIPYPLSKKIAGTFVTGLNIPINEVFLKSKEISKKFKSQNSKLKSQNYNSNLKSIQIK